MNTNESMLDDDDSWMDEYAVKDDDDSWMDEFEVPKESDQTPSNVGEIAKDVGVQAVRGAASAFTWPLDVLKSLVVGAHHPMDEKEILELERRTGIPINREELQKSQEQFSQIGKNVGEYIATQDAAEKQFEKSTGISLEPKTLAGKFTRQASELAALSRGKGVTKALARGTAGAATTLGLEESGAASPEISKMAGDVLSIMSLRRPRGFTASEQALKQVADEHKLPFPELMTRVKTPFIRAEMSKDAKDALVKQFDMTTKQAIDAVSSQKLPIMELQKKGVNLDAFQRNAHDEVDRAAAFIPAKTPTGPIIRKIDEEILRLNPSLADKTKVKPSSHADQKAIDVLREHKKQLEPKNEKSPSKEMTALELIERYRDNNQNVRELYRKAHETPVDKEVEHTYAFLNKLLMDQIESVGGKKLGEQFRAANKITKQVKEVSQVEKFLGTAMEDGSFVPGKLEKRLNSPKSDKVKKILGTQAIQDINDIAKYRTKAEQNIEKFLNLPGQTFRKEISDWGVLAPFLFFSAHAGVGTYIARKGIARIQGRLLTRPATRKEYLKITKHAAAGQYDLLRKDFDALNTAISQEFGSPETFIDDSMLSDDEE